MEHKIYDKITVQVEERSRMEPSDTDLSNRVYRALFDHLDQGNHMALTSALLDIEALPPDVPQRAPLLDSARRAIALHGRLEEYQNKERTLRAVFEVAQALTELKNLDDVLLDIVRRSRLLLGSDIAWLAGEEDGQMRVLAIEGAHTMEAREMSVPTESGIAGYVKRTAAVFSTRDYHADPGIEHDRVIDTTLAREGIQSALAAPLLSESEVIGVLILGDRDTRTHQQWEKSTLATFAAQASVAIRNARAFAAKRIALNDAEQANTQLQDQVAQLETSIDAHDRIARQLAQNGTLDDMAGVIANLLHGEIVFFDPMGQEICSARSRTAGDLPKRAMGRADPAMLVASENGRSAGRSVPLPGMDVASRVVAVVGGGDMLGTLLIRTATALDDHEIRIFERGSTAIAVMALRAEKVHASAQQDVALTIRGLLAPGRYRDTDLDARARQHGLDLTRPVALAVIETERSRMGFLRRRLAGKLRLQPHLMAEVDDRLFLLINHPEPLNLCADLQKALFSDPGMTGYAAVSALVTGAAGLPDLYGGCQRAIDLMRKLDRPGQVVFEPELALYAILFRDQGAADLTHLIDATLGPLFDADPARGATLADTLLAFLDLASNARATAQNLGIHVNTVHNRIETVERLLGHQARDAKALELHVALRLRRLRDL